MNIDWMDDFIKNHIIGKTLEEAYSSTKKHSLDSRVVFEDGEYYIVTCDLNFDRLNFYIENGIVVNANVG